MGLFGKLFKNRDHEDNKEKKVNLKAKCSKELQRAEEAANKKCWCAALFWSTKTLEITSDSRSAKDLFMTALANTAVGFVTIFQRNKKDSPLAIKLLKQRNMNLEEAEFVADAMISISYLEFIQSEYNHLLDKLNNGTIKESSSIAESDLKSAREMGLALGDEILPGQETSIHWDSTLKAESDSHFSSGITNQKESLKILLQASHPSDWSDTCNRLYMLWKNIPGEDDLAGSFHAMANNHPMETEFQEQRSKFEQIFQRNAADLIWARNLFREPR